LPRSHTSEDPGSNPGAESNRVHSKDVLRDIAPSCPECTSQRVWRDGTRRTRHGDVQRYLCRACGYRFSEPHLNRSDQSEGLQRIHRISFYPNVALLYDRQVGATEPRGAKNLVQVENRQKQAAGATQKQPMEEIRGKIIEFGWWLKKQGRKDSTVEEYMKMLTTVAKRGFNILDPENVKEAISVQPWCDQRKGVFVEIYNRFLEMLGKTWIPPSYTTKTRKLPYIPLESDVDQLIAACRHKLGTFTQLIKETGIRPGEAWTLKWIDFDPTRRTINIQAEKGSNPRMLPLSQQLTARIDMLPKESEYIFRNGFLKFWTSYFWQVRKKRSTNLQNPRILKITWKSLRHLKGTMLYHKTRDILHVKEVLGHVNIQNTLIYIHLENALYKTANDEFHVKVAKTPDEVEKLLEVGFEYVCDMENAKFFRKRK